MFILDRIDRELPSLERLEIKFGLSSEFFNKIPVRVVLDVPFRLRSNSSPMILKIETFSLG